MTEHETSRTLVKSPPELWAECSDATSLARHLEGFGEIRITKLDPETAVAWEGERASGTVRLEPAGWGTRVTLTARGEPADGDLGPGAETRHFAEGEPEPVVVQAEPEAVEVQAEPEAVEVQGEPVDAAVAEPGPSGNRRGLLARLLGFLRGGSGAPNVETPDAVAADAAAEEAPEAAAEDAPSPVAADAPGAITAGAPNRDAHPDRRSLAGAAAGGDAAPPPVDLLTAALESLGQAHHRPFSRA